MPTVTYPNPGSLGDIDPALHKQIPDFMAESLLVGDFAEGQNFGATPRHPRFADYKFKVKGFHPVIPYICIRRYTKPNELVWDPFAGSGTTMDVALSLNRRCIASDLHPARADITPADASKWNPGANKVHLLVLQPPYMGLVGYDSPMSDTHDTSVFQQLFVDCMQNMDKALIPGRMMSVTVGEMVVDGVMITLDTVIINAMQQFKHYRLVARIVSDFYTNSNYYHYRKYGLLQAGRFMIGRDFTLIFQKGITK